MQNTNRAIVLKMRESVSALIKDIGGILEQHDPILVGEIVDLIKTSDRVTFNRRNAESVAAGNRFIMDTLARQIFSEVFPPKPHNTVNRDEVSHIILTITKHITTYMRATIDEFLALKRDTELHLARNIVDLICIGYNTEAKQKRIRIVSDIIAAFDYDNCKTMRREAADMFIHMFLVNPIYEVCVCLHPDNFDAYYRHHQLIRATLSI